MTPVFEGVLEKRGGGHWSSRFRTRYFQLQCGFTEKRLVYFKGNPKTHDEKGRIDLNTAKSITLNKSNKEIVISTPKRNWVLRGKNVAECQTWIEQMNRNSEEAQQDTIRKTIRLDPDFLEDLWSESQDVSHHSSFTSDTTSYDPSSTESGLSIEQLNSGSKDSQRKHKRQISELHSADTLRRRLTEFPTDAEQSIYDARSPSSMLAYE